MVPKMENYHKPVKKLSSIFALHRTQTPQPVKFDNEPIGWKSSVKYLGVILDKKLNWWASSIG